MPLAPPRGGEGEEGEEGRTPFTAFAWILKIKKQDAALDAPASVSFCMCTHAGKHTHTHTHTHTVHNTASKEVKKEKRQSREPKKQKHEHYVAGKIQTHVLGRHHFFFFALFHSKNDSLPKWQSVEHAISRSSTNSSIICLLTTRY